MAKRFIDTEIFDDDWFMELSKDGKLFWLYCITKCDLAGLIKINEKLCKVQTDIKDIPTVIQELGNRLVTVGEQLIFIPKFVEYQYPGFPDCNFNAARSAITKLEKYGLIKNGSLTVHQELTNSYGKGNSIGNGIGKGNKGGVGGKTYIEQIVQLFQKSFPGYIIVNFGKEKQSASNLLRAFKKQYPDYNSEEMLQVLREYFEKCKTIQDSWLKNNMSLAIMSSKYNEINRIINVKKDNNERKGATLEDIEAFRRNLSIQ